MSIACTVGAFKASKFDTFFNRQQWCVLPVANSIPHANLARGGEFDTRWVRGFALTRLWRSFPVDSGRRGPLRRWTVLQGVVALATRVRLLRSKARVGSPTMACCRACIVGLWSGGFCSLVVWLPNKAVGTMGTSASPHPPVFGRCFSWSSLCHTAWLFWRLFEGALLRSPLLMSPSTDARYSNNGFTSKGHAPPVVFFTGRVGKTGVFIFPMALHVILVLPSCEKRMGISGGWWMSFGSLYSPWSFWSLLVVLATCISLPLLSSWVVCCFLHQLAPFRLWRLTA